MRNALTRAAARSSRTAGRFALFLLACFAVVLLGAVAAAVHAAPGLAPALLDGAHLSVAVDWLTGFTGHADVGLGHGIALATGTAAAVKPKPAGTGAGEQRQVVVNLTDDQLRALGILDDDEDLTEEEITRAVEDLAPETPPPDPQSTGTPAPAQRKTEIAPDRGAVNERVGYGYGHQDHWARRTVRYFNALARSREDMEGSVREVSRLRRTLAEMPDGQWRAEEEEANRVIAEAGLTREQQQRLQAFLEVGPFTRLHTTSTADTPKAGYLLPKPFLAEVFVVVEQYGVVRRLFRSVPMVSKTLDLKNVSTKVTGYWVDEGDKITASDLVLAEGQLTLAKLAGITSWTTELEEDQAIALLPILTTLFAEAFMEKEDQAGLIGDGSGTYGSFTGLLNLSGAQVVTMGAGLDAGSDLAETHLRQAKNKLSLARRMGARWIMHYSFHEHIAQLQNTAGYRIFQENISGNAPDTLLGFPIEYSEVMPDIDSVGANEKFMILGQSNRALMGQGRGVTADISRDAVLQAGDGSIAYNAFQADGALLRLTERVAFQVPTAVQTCFVVIRTAQAAET